MADKRVNSAVSRQWIFSPFARSTHAEFSRSIDAVFQYSVLSEVTLESALSTSFYWLPSHPKPSLKLVSSSLPVELITGFVFCLSGFPDPQIYNFVPWLILQNAVVDGFFYFYCDWEWNLKRNCKELKSCSAFAVSINFLSCYLIRRKLALCPSLARAPRSGNWQDVLAALLCILIMHYYFFTSLVRLQPRLLIISISGIHAISQGVYYLLFIFQTKSNEIFFSWILTSCATKTRFNFFQTCKLKTRQPHTPENTSEYIPVNFHSPIRRKRVTVNVLSRIRYPHANKTLTTIIIFRKPKNLHTC